ncbi:MAG TPA: ribosome maturation factor RimP [Clostridiales bacterium]|nr:ribosome maturation factor RimP [Clostridiales bacterium]
MNGKKVVSIVMPMATKIVSDLGYALVDVEYRKQFDGMVLEFFIDSPTGININDCEKVSKALDEPLDQLNPTNDVPYSLNVSSLGLDTPLTTEYEFNKYKGKEVELKFYQPIQPFNKKQLSAVLDSWNDSEIIVTIDNQNITISRKSIAQIVPVIKF